MNLASAFGQKFQDHKDAIRIRSFELGGHTFKVKVPLTIELDAMYEVIKKPDEEAVEKYYAELSKTFIENRDTYKDNEEIQFTDDDVIVQGRSMREAAKNKATSEKRITEMFKLLVPEEQGFDMNTITYDMIEELFPFSIQLEIMDNISKVVSPDYKEKRGK